MTEQWTEAQLVEMGLTDPVEKAMFVSGCMHHRICNNGEASGFVVSEDKLQKFAESIVNECIDIIETHEIPVGNSAAGEMACEWTYDALKQIRDQIKERFGVE